MALINNPYQPMQTMGQPIYTPYQPTQTVGQPTYTPYFPQFNQQVYQQQNSLPTNNNMILAWIQGGENGAKAYPLGPNCRAFLFDSEKDVFYIKTTDQSGMSQPLRLFEYSEVFQKEESGSVDTSAFVTKDELEEIISKALSKKKENYNNGKSFVRGNNEQRNERAVQ